MLAASEESPNIAVPKPANWRGVAESLAQAEQEWKRGDAHAAERRLTELLEFAPNEWRAWRLLAHVQRDLGKIREGIHSANTAIRLRQREIDAHAAPASLRLAKLLWQQGEHDQALAMLDDLLAQRPGDTQLQALRQAWQKRVKP